MESERGTSVVHQYKNNGYDIVLDVNSGAVHVVDDLVYDVIASLKNKELLENRITEDILLLFQNRTLYVRWRFCDDSAYRA